MMDCSPKRKPNRLKDYDYSTNGAYFITVCTHNHRCIFWKNVGASIARPYELSEYGKVVDDAVIRINDIYPCVFVDKYVIMPNHIHIILRIDNSACGRPMVAPTVSTVIQQLKGFITKQIGVSVWQKLFHDHIIRNEQDYETIWEYIETNPQKWKEDCFYTE